MKKMIAMTCMLLLTGNLLVGCGNHEENTPVTDRNYEEQETESEIENTTKSKPEESEEENESECVALEEGAIWADEFLEYVEFIRLHVGRWNDFSSIMEQTDHAQVANGVYSRWHVLYVHLGGPFYIVEPVTARINMTYTMDVTEYAADGSKILEQTKGPVTETVTVTWDADSTKWDLSLLESYLEYYDADGNWHKTETDDEAFQCMSLKGTLAKLSIPERAWADHEDGTRSIKIQTDAGVVYEIWEDDMDATVLPLLQELYKPTT